MDVQTDTEFVTEDTKDEVLAVFGRRPLNSATKWSFSMDEHYGNPIELCRCGHRREEHGLEDKHGRVGGGCQCSNVTAWTWNTVKCPCPKFRTRKKPVFRAHER